MRIGKKAQETREREQGSLPPPCGSPYMKEKICLVLDVGSRKEAMDLVRPLHDLAGMFKVGLQLFTAEGPSIVRDIIEAGGKVLLDLKFHDIPNTVKNAAVEWPGSASP